LKIFNSLCSFLTSALLYSGFSDFGARERMESRPCHTTTVLHHQRR